MSGLSGVVAGMLAFLAGHELPGLFVFLVVEEAGVPLLVPGDTLIVMAGAQAGRPLGSALLVLVAAAAAAICGSSLLYWVVRRGGRPLLTRYGRVLRLSEGRIALLESWFKRHGALAIIVGRLLPGLRTPTSAMAGLFGVPYRTFAPATALAAVLWALLYYLGGIFLRLQWPEMVGALSGDIDAAVVVLVALLAIAPLTGALVWRRHRGRLGPDAPARQ